MDVENLQQALHNCTAIFDLGSDTKVAIWGSGKSRFQQRDGLRERVADKVCSGTSSETGIVSPLVRDWPLTTRSVTGDPTLAGSAARKGCNVRGLVPRRCSSVHSHVSPVTGGRAQCNMAFL
jgi:hypothetical protein